MFQTISASEARKRFSDLVSSVAFGKSPVVISRQGKEIAAVIPIEQLALLEEALEKAEDAKDLEMIRADRDTDTVPWEALKDELSE